MDNDRFARTIKNARLKKGYTQSQLADLLKVSNKTISKWETGRGYPDITLLAKITSILKLDYEELLQSNEYIIQKRKKKRKDIFIISIVCFIFAITLIGMYKVQKQQKYENEIAKTVPCGTDAGRFFPKVGYQPHPRGHSCDICMDRRLEILELRSRRNRSVRGKQSFYEFLLR